MSDALPPAPLAPAATAPGTIPGTTRRDRTWVPWDWTDIVLWVVGAVCIYVGLSIALVLLTFRIDPHFNIAKPSPLFNLLNQIVLDGTCAALVLVLVLVRRHGNPSMVGLSMPSLRWFALVPLLVAASYALALSLSVASDRLFPSATSNQCQEVKAQFGTDYALAFIAVAICAPIAEELVFRGFLFGWLRAKMPLWLAAGVSGAVFAAVHAQGALTLALMGVGIMLAYAYHRSGSLYVTMLTHATFNAINLWAILYQPC